MSTVLHYIATLYFYAVLSPFIIMGVVLAITALCVSGNVLVYIGRVLIGTQPVNWSGLAKVILTCIVAYVAWAVITDDRPAYPSYYDSRSDRTGMDAIDPSGRYH